MGSAQLKRHKIKFDGGLKACSNFAVQSIPKSILHCCVYTPPANSLYFDHGIIEDIDAYVIALSHNCYCTILVQFCNIISQVMTTITSLLLSN